MKDLIPEAKQALVEATKGEDWTNFDGRDHSRTVYEYDRLTEDACDIIVECMTEEIALLIANAPEWLRQLVDEVERLQTKMEIDAAFAKVVLAERNLAWHQLESQKEQFEKLKLHSEHLQTLVDGQDQSHTDYVNETETLIESQKEEIEKLVINRDQLASKSLAEFRKKNELIDIIKKSLEWYSKTEKYVSYEWFDDGHPKSYAIIDDAGLRARTILDFLQEGDK